MYAFQTILMRGLPAHNAKLLIFESTRVTLYKTNGTSIGGDIVYNKTSFFKVKRS